MSRYWKYKIYIYHITMLIWIIFGFIYLLGNYIMPDNIEYLPYLTDLFYVIIIMIVFEPFIHYWIKLKDQRINVFEIIGGVLFVIIATILIGIFFLMNYRKHEPMERYLYTRDSFFVNDKITVYEPDNILFMKVKEIYYIEKYDE